MAYLKKDAPADVLETLRGAEAQADECWRGLQILQSPSNTALWVLLTGGIGMVEREQAARGSNTPHFDPMLINVSRLLAIAVKWGIRHGQPVTAPVVMDWTHERAAAVDQALSLATAYSHFEVCFQGFHKNVSAVDVLTPTLLRFTAPGGERDRQVSAYQKSLRPREGRFAGQRASQQPQSPPVQEASERVLRGCLQTSARSFAYGDPWDLWRELLPEYRDRVRALARRADSLSLGDYRLDEFNAFYAALIAVCAAHDSLCYRWGQICGAYPIESAVMVRAASEWSAVLSALSGVAREKCQVMVSDLTFSVTQSVNLHVYPFIPLDGASGTLALAPPFPLHSRHDENILRVCSQRRPQVYDVTSLEKESEMLADLRIAGERYGADGPLSLPNPVPDIDLIAVDESSSTVVIGEVKWIRKTVRPAEIPERDADVLKGIGQLETIRTFLAANPEYLPSVGRLPRRLSEYEHVQYLLIARDHWRWVEPRDGIAVLEFDTFARMLARSNNLHQVVDDLLTYDWLPVEGRDFTVRYDRATANGVSVESQVFYSTAPP
jgi:hypothetical protein